MLTFDLLAILVIIVCWFLLGTLAGFINLKKYPSVDTTLGLLVFVLMVSFGPLSFLILIKEYLNHK